MTDPKLYPIAPEIFETRESELNSRLPELYPNEAERQIAEQILVPQLRSVIDEVLSNFNYTRGELALTPPSPAELPNLCAKIDKALDANRNLLDSEGLGKPLFEYISSVRELVKAEMVEAFKAHCRSLFAAHGVMDRVALLDKGSVWFRNAEFPPYGKGISYANIILNERVKPLFFDHLRRIADILGWLDLDEENRLQHYRSLLELHNISDWNTLLANGSHWFRNANFPPYGKGSAFASLLIGEAVSKVTLDHLRRIADILSLPSLSEETKRGLRTAIIIHNVADRNSLLAKGVVWFRNANFPPYGRGTAFAGLVLGKVISKVNMVYLHRIADILFPEQK